MPARSPFAPDRFAAPSPVAGLRLGGIAAGLKYQGRPDLFMAELAPGTAVAGALTRSSTRAAPVDWCRDVLAGGTARAILVNAGNANAFTGEDGIRATRRMAEAVAANLHCRAGEVLIASTGVIGEYLPLDGIVRAIPELHGALHADGWSDAAHAILTTDTFAKPASVVSDIAGHPVTLSGFAKGSGMIAPDMATMLAFVFTDAQLPTPVLRALCAGGVDRSFNCMTVDGDCSTNDTVILAATGKAGNPPPDSPAAPELAAFRAALDRVMQELAIQIVKDGEGAQKFITIDVTGAKDDASARRIGLAVANSPLVKTAIAGGDANWGRIIMAVGHAGEPVERDRLTVALGGIPVAERGAAASGADAAAREVALGAHLRGREIGIAVDIGLGTGRARVWSCDLTHGYIDINADYRS